MPENVDALSVTATTDLALMPDGWRLDGAADACPLREAHPYLPITPAFDHVVQRHLDEDRDGEVDGGVGECARWPEVYRLASQGISAPPTDA